MRDGGFPVFSTLVFLRVIEAAHSAGVLLHERTNAHRPQAEIHMQTCVCVCVVTLSGSTNRKLEAFPTTGLVFMAEDSAYIMSLKNIWRKYDLTFLREQDSPREMCC